MKTSKTFRLMLVLCSTFYLAQASKASDTGQHLFILSGQSNMRGALPQTFKNCVSEVFGKEHVIVITAARPSQPIKEWYKKWTPPVGQESDGKPVGTFYDGLIKRVKKETEGKKLASVNYIWMQGEADAGNGWASVYERSFLGILDQIEEDIEVKDINFILGRINDHWLPKNGIVDGEAIRELQVKIGEEHTNGDWVNTDDLNTGINPWGLFELDGGHFPDISYHILGQRFARKACLLIDPKIKLYEKLFAESFIDSAAEITNHLAIGASIVGTMPDSKYKGGDAGLGLLVDGKYGSVDENDGMWLGFPLTDNGIVLSVDLGKSQVIKGIAANLLYKPDAKAGLPDSILIEISEDGKDYTSVNSRGPYKVFYGKKQREMKTKNLKTQPLLILADYTVKKTRAKEKKARYIKITIKAATSWLFIDEIIINPIAGGS